MTSTHIHIHGRQRSARSLDGLVDRIRAAFGREDEPYKSDLTQENRMALRRWHLMVQRGEVQNTPENWNAYLKKNNMDGLPEELIARAKRNLTAIERTPEERIARAEKAIKKDIGAYRRTQAANQSLKSMLARLDDCSCGGALDGDPAAEIAALKAELRTATDPNVRRRLEDEIDTREWEVQMQRITRKGARDARMFPSYTLADLKRWLTDPNVPEATKEKARAEIQARESGASTTKVTPQIESGAGGAKPTNKIGRL